MNTEKNEAQGSRVTTLEIELSFILEEVLALLDQQTNLQWDRAQFGVFVTTNPEDRQQAKVGAITVSFGRYTPPSLVDVSLNGSTPLGEGDLRFVEAMVRLSARRKANGRRMLRLTLNPNLVDEETRRQLSETGWEVFSPALERQKVLADYPGVSMLPLADSADFLQLTFPVLEGRALRAQFAKIKRWLV